MEDVDWLIMIIFWSLFPEARKLDNKEGKNFCRNVSESQQRALSYHWSVAAVPSHHWWTLSSSLGLDPGPTFLPDQAWPWRERCAEIQTPFTLQKEITPDLMRLDLCRRRDDSRSSWPQSLILDGAGTMRLSEYVFRDPGTGLGQLPGGKHSLSGSGVLSRLVIRQLLIVKLLPL